MFFALWSVLSIALGVGGSFIPWRKSSAFHYGWGSPTPMVVFERSDNGYINFPVPAAIIINPILVFFIGGFCWITVFFVRRLSQLKNPPNPESANP